MVPAWRNYNIFATGWRMLAFRLAGKNPRPYISHALAFAHRAPNLTHRRGPGEKDAQAGPLRGSAVLRGKDIYNG
ncbi:hypothetical protein CCR94_14535 [Rhodoblastus sphagnicola]|uniref:Uncharacterized protein n=1 Tax=Rhodoblastus sphagnicola TaxID=333368 RepID=A0A2S6N5H4_9HYPH|nr:hypothetical protein CCR94_14535 [Rhodoblastus sphagnicola]